MITFKQTQDESAPCIDSDAVSSLRRMFHPKCVAVVGASRDEQRVGGLLFRNLIDCDFAGDVYAVNPNADQIAGQTVYARIADCPQTPDLVIVAVPSKIVLDVVDEAGKMGVASACVITAGFSEVNEAGQRRAHELLALARRHSMRLVGPNCMGLLNASPQVRLNATFSHVFPDGGRVAMLSQSGAIGLAVLSHAAKSQLGLSSFVSLGNKLDVNANDLVEYWRQDEQTDVLLMYLESLDDPHRFRDLACQTTREKPIVVLKAGRTSVGRRAAASHTAAVAGEDAAADALFRQSGVLRMVNLRDAFQTTRLLISQPPLRGNRVAIVTNGGGPGILAADACDEFGLDVPALSDNLRQQLDELLPSTAATENPIDLLADADAAVYRQTIELIGKSDEFDALMIVFVPPIVTQAEDVAKAIATAKNSLPSELSFVSVFMGSEQPADELKQASVPVFVFPEEAARAMANAWRWAKWRDRPEGKVILPEPIDHQRARQVITKARSTAADENANGYHEGSKLWLTGRQATDLLKAYGVPLAEAAFVSDSHAAAKAQQQLATPVAVKIDAPIHKSDIQGVVLGCQTPEQASQAVGQLERAIERADKQQYLGRYLVQSMVDEGIEMAVGVRRDPTFGPLLMVGFGGEMLELIGDVSISLTPITDLDAQEMLESLKTYPLLKGYRGKAAGDIQAFKDLMYRVARLAQEVDDLVELDLNPVFVHPQGVTVADVRLAVDATNASR